MQKKKLIALHCTAFRERQLSSPVNQSGIKKKPWNTTVDLDRNLH